MIRDGENDADEDRNRTREKREGRHRPGKGGLFNPFKHSIEVYGLFVRLPCAGRTGKDPYHTHPFWELIQIHLSHVLPRELLPLHRVWRHFLVSHSAPRRGHRLLKGPGTVGRPQLVSSQTQLAHV